MAETEFTLRVEREDRETLVLNGLALARAFFTGASQEEIGQIASRYDFQVV
jgi:acetolactate synthase small subunit